MFLEHGRKILFHKCLILLLGRRSRPTGHRWDWFLTTSSFLCPLPWPLQVGLTLLPCAPILPQHIVLELLVCFVQFYSWGYKQCGAWVLMVVMVVTVM